MAFLDAHNHLHDERFGDRQPALVAECRRLNIAGMVVNGSCEEDWPRVAELARSAPDLIIPAFGLHPWYVHERNPDWKERLRAALEEFPHATIGEIGLDRWILDTPPKARRAISPELANLPAAPLQEQTEVFVEQLSLAAQLNRPASIHCLQAWGPLFECLRAGPLPAAGFLLHSYGGSADLVHPFARLGAYFSFPGYFLHPRKTRQRETFRTVPANRLLVETDAPDQRLPDNGQLEGLPEWKEVGPVRELTDDQGRPLNSPANLPIVYSGLGAFLQLPLAELKGRIEANFSRLFSESMVGKITLPGTPVEPEDPRAERSRGSP